MEKLTDVLLFWYDRNRRILPWREDPTPYHIWLSEIILQQTRVEAGKDVYLRFLKVCPDIATLASTKEDVCLKLWEGLGYYSRVRNLHRAAVIIMQEYDGQMPGTKEELQKLPGIGPYTAAAIASIAYGEKEIALDGNLMRIFSRMTEYGEDSKTKVAKECALTYYEPLISEERPGDFNQALMDLGAMICLPHGQPHCSVCPWEASCSAHRHNTTNQYPIMPQRKLRKKEEKTVLILQCQNKTAIRKRSGQGLLAGLYEFPLLDGYKTVEEVKEWLSQHGISSDDMLGSPQKLPYAKHIFTHVEWNMIGYRILFRSKEGMENPSCLVSNGSFPPQEDLESIEKFIWADPDELDTVYSIPSAFAVYRQAAKNI